MFKIKRQNNIEQIRPPLVQNYTYRICAYFDLSKWSALPKILTGKSQSLEDNKTDYLFKQERINEATIHSHNHTSKSR